ncbi:MULTISPECIES: ABC transporter ATP-binding protein [unclassified Arthrobacter]|uniref:ABC transporter ATP-binding protein n=1 Tax=unclassified Arthrobacter TaxID=235627 RepID=UPI003396CAF1
MSEPTAAAPRVEVRAINKSFELGHGQSRPVINNVNFSAQQGEFLAIIGPSGCGKSTLFNIMAGLEKPRDGEILIDGRSVTGEREHFAYMPQKDLLFPWRTILQNTALGLEVCGGSKKTARARAASLFPAFGLAGFENSHPFELSGGMRQRAALLRTVVQDRDVLLLDEPFGALDSLTRTDMQAWLQDVWSHNSWTAVLITHDIREAIYLADRVVVLSPRPASVRLNLPIDLPRPRQLSMMASARFAHYELQLLETLHRPGNLNDTTDAAHGRPRA